MWLAKKLSENKWLEVQVEWWKPYTIFPIFSRDEILFDDTHYFLLKYTLLGSFFNFEIGWDKKTDHCGFTFEFSILGLFFNFNISDNRHWDDETDDYCVYEGEYTSYTEEQKQEIREAYQKIIDKSKDIK